MDCQPKVGSDHFISTKIEQEVAFSLKTKGIDRGLLTKDGTYRYTGYMTDGRRMVMIFEADGTLFTAYPIFK